MKDPIAIGRAVVQVGLILAALGLVIFLNRADPVDSRPQEVSYSRFLDALDREAVTEASISPEAIVWREGADPENPLFQATRVPGAEDSEIVARLHETGALITGEIPGEGWGVLLVWLLPLGILIVFWVWVLRGMRGGGMRGGGGAEALSFGASRPKIWDQSTAQVTFDDVAGVDEAVTELREVADFLRNKERYTRVGARIPKGVLLVGPTGTGKTLLARATAGEAGVPFFTISGAEFVEMFVGVGAARVRDLFRQAREKAPCIVFIDEIDGLGKARAGPGSPVSNDEREQTLNQLLIEMDGFDASVGVIIMAATNRPDLLDTALQRPGRFDRQVVVDRPDLPGRQAILEIHARRVQLEPEVDLRVVAARTPGFAGAQLANVINEAALLAVRSERERVTMKDLDEAIDRVMAGLERTSRALIAMEQEIVAHHEMGHALVSMLLPRADPVHKVSIVPRGATALGVTIQTPLHDRYLLTESELRDRLTVALGGRAAEEVVFGETSTGAADDLVRATELARRMVTQFGMTEGVGPVSLDDGRGSAFGELSFPSHRYSEETAQAVDAEVRRLVEEAHDRALRLLREGEDALRTLAGELREKEVIEGAELARRMEELGCFTPGAPTHNEGPMRPPGVDTAHPFPHRNAEGAVSKPSDPRPAAP